MKKILLMKQKKLLFDEALYKKMSNIKIHMEMGMLQKEIVDIIINVLR